MLYMTCCMGGGGRGYCDLVWTVTNDVNRHQPRRSCSVGTSKRHSAESLVQDVRPGGGRSTGGERSTCGIFAGQAQWVVFPPLQYRYNADAACFHAHSSVVVSLWAFVLSSRFATAPVVCNGRDAEEEEALQQALRASQLESESADEVCAFFCSVR